MVAAESGFEPWDDTLEQIRIQGPGDKLIFWSWVHFKVPCTETGRGKNGKKHIIISMIMSIYR